MAGQMRSLAVALILTAAAPAFAQDFEAAGKHFQAAQEAFAQQRFKAAAVEFQAAYDNSKDPILLYNVGEAWERGGDGHKAVDAYRAYLKAMPSATDKAEVQRRIAAIVSKKYKLVDESAPDSGGESAKAHGRVAPTPPPGPAAPPEKTMTPSFDTPPPAAAPTPPPESEKMLTPSFDTPPPSSPPTEKPSALPPPEPAPMAEMPPPGLLDQGPPSKLRVTAWVGVATSLAFLTTGAILGLAAQSRSDEISRRFNFVDPSTGMPKKYDPQTASDIDSLRSDGQLYNTVGITFYSLAAASAVATAVLFVVDSKRPREKAHALHLLPSLGKGSAGVAAAWTF
jgi:hypothetical protein